MASKKTARRTATAQSQRRNWQTVKFGDVVKNCTASERDPLAAGIERYVALEHLEPENLHIKEWGLVEDGTSFTRKFEKGQVLFAKRRAYQRKVAVAEFDGICSSDILVFEPKDDELIPELLPFIVQSDGFFDHALGTSAGSLSPRTRWSQLRDYEFPLPPKDEQRRIAEILWAADDVVVKSESLISAADLAKRSLVRKMLTAFAPSCTKPLRKLLKASPEGGHSASPAPRETGHYVLALSALTAGGYRRGHLKPVVPDDKICAAKLHKGDFLISRSNTVELVGLVGIFSEDREDVSFPDTMLRLEVDEAQVMKEFLELVLLSHVGRKHMRRVAAGTSGSMKKINRKTLASCAIPCPDLESQREIVMKSRSFSRAIRVAEEQRHASLGLRLSLANRLFSTPLETSRNVQRS